MKSLVLLTAVILLSAQSKASESNSKQLEDARLDRAVRAVDALYSGLNSNTVLSRRKRSTYSQVSKEQLKAILRNICEPEPKVPSLPGPCSSSDTVNLTQWWRNGQFGNKLKPANGNYNCDKDILMNAKWFRIQGSAGNKILNSCPPAYSCGAHGAMWTNASLPTRVGQTVQIPIYGSWSGNCDWYPWPVLRPLTVQRCSAAEGDFVYKAQGLKGCNWSICGMN